MSFFDNLRKNLEETAVYMGKKTKDLVDITRLDLKVRKYSDEIDDLFRELGEMTYDIKIGYHHDSYDMERICEEIGRKKDYLSDIKKQIDLIKQDQELYEEPLEDTEELPSFIKIPKESSKPHTNAEGFAVLKFCANCQIGNNPEADCCISCGHPFDV